MPSDKPKIYQGLSHPDVIRYYGVSYQTYEDTQVQMDWYDYLLVSETGIWWAICDRTAPETLIGACGFDHLERSHRRTETGYWLLPDYWGMGVMSECFPAIIRYAFSELDLHRIMAVVETENAGSRRLLEKLGFNYEGTHRECEIKNGAFISLDYYALLSTDAFIV
jgi:ribosomal-protein-alanine N-acetyltransferase